jgi:hypothetical protein
VALLSLPGSELVRVVSVAQVLLRAHLRHPVQYTGLNSVRDKYGTGTLLKEECQINRVSATILHHLDLHVMNKILKIISFYW